MPEWNPFECFGKASVDIIVGRGTVKVTKPGGSSRVEIERAQRGTGIPGTSWIRTVSATFLESIFRQKGFNAEKKTKKNWEEK